MTQNPWTQKACEKCVKHYIDETNRQDFTPTEIAAWAQERGYALPEPMTGVEILARLIAESATKARRRDAKTSILYRATLAFSAIIKGERKRMWFDADGPAATDEKIEQSIRQRMEQALNIMVSAAATRERYLQTHPNAKLEKIDLSISEEEVLWRLLGKAASDDEAQQAG
jgi:hypothetical protein